VIKVRIVIISEKTPKLFIKEVSKLTKKDKEILKSL